jgi:hypothetical protein
MLTPGQLSAGRRGGERLAAALDLSMAAHACCSGYHFAMQRRIEHRERADRYGCLEADEPSGARRHLGQS